MRRPLVILLALALLVGCPSTDDDDSAPPTATPASLPSVEVAVTVSLDGAPVAGATLAQGGVDGRWTTGEDGRAVVRVDLTLIGQLMIIAAHPQARQTGVEIDREDPEEAVTIALSSFETQDNPAYVFKDPGEPDRRESTAQCAHCHLTINADWLGSKHAESARDPQVQDVYRATATARDTQPACEDAGGAWLEGRCYLGDGALPDLNDCGPGPCVEATAFGGCADCHAPGIDGALGGRDLREATGHAYDYGVHCDVCHRVESVDLGAEAGVAGALRLLRPSGPGAFTWPERPLTFGPYDDVPLGVMGAVQRDHFGDATLCAGCHELAQQVLVPGAAIDLQRWPDGRLPIHTTYSEWRAGPMAPAVACPACHMPPDPDVGNGADIQLGSIDGGMVAGWWRAPGAVRRHSFDGPEDGAGPMLRLAASLDLVTAREGDVLTATVTVRNAGAGHAIPTGEPLRSLVLAVESRCGGDALTPLSGLAIPDVGGALAMQEAGADWTRWPGAQVGQVVRVVRLPGAWLDDVGAGPFGDGTFMGADKGLPVSVAVGAVTIEAMDGDVATFDGPLPDGDRAFLGEPATLEPGSVGEALAGAPGHAFARVLVGPDGTRNVPHHLAVDVVSDNRILPAQEWSGAWAFDAPCAAPVTTATLLYRQWPLELARQRGWGLTDVVVQEAVR